MCIDNKYYNKDYRLLGKYLFKNNTYSTSYDLQVRVSIKMESNGRANLRSQKMARNDFLLHI